MKHFKFLLPVFLLLTLTVAPAVITFAQDGTPPDTTVVIGDDITTKLPWLTILITAAVAAIPTVAWARSNRKLAKFIVLAKVIVEISQDRIITDAEFKRAAAALKDLLSKEGELPGGD